MSGFFFCNYMQPFLHLTEHRVWNLWLNLNWSSCSAQGFNQVLFLLCSLLQRLFCKIQPAFENKTQYEGQSHTSVRNWMKKWLQGCKTHMRERTYLLLWSDQKVHLITCAVYFFFIFTVDILQSNIVKVSGVAHIHLGTSAPYLYLKYAPDILCMNTRTGHQWQSQSRWGSAVQQRSMTRCTAVPDPAEGFRFIPSEYFTSAQSSVFSQCVWGSKTIFFFKKTNLWILFLNTDCSQSAPDHCS